MPTQYHPKEISLFTGAGGGVLASKILGHKIVGYVEIEKYCQKVIRQRIDDGVFDCAPIFTDVREFVESGAAREYRGFAEVVSAGFPCQPFSVAGQNAGADDPRNMWPATMDTIRAVRPRIAFLENVPGLLTNEYIRTIFRDLAEAGYDAEWCVLGADELGAPHRRKRIWVYARNAESKSGNISKSKVTEHQEQQKPKPRNADKQITAANAWRKRVQRDKQDAVQRQSTLPWGENLQGIEDIGERSDIPEPLVRRMDDGVANRTNRHKAIGNGQVPIVAAVAFKMLERRYRGGR